MERIGARFYILENACLHFCPAAVRRNKLFVAKFPKPLDSFPVQTDITYRESYCRVIMETYFIC